MSNAMTPKERSEHLFKVLTSQRFLNKQGLGNEVPFFICPYPASEGLSMQQDRQDLVARIGHAGVTALDLSLYDLSLDLLKERDILAEILDIEPDTEKSELLELLRGVLDVHEPPILGQAFRRAQDRFDEGRRRRGREADRQGLG